MVKYSWIKWGDIDFIQWKKDFDSHTLEERREVFDFRYTTFPKRVFYDARASIKFFDSLKHIPELRVIEIGGGKGGLACKTIAGSIANIVCWENYDISRVAIENTICDNPKYHPILLYEYIQNLDVFDKYNVFLSTDFIEHIKVAELTILFKKLAHIEHIYLFSPLPQLDKDIRWGVGQDQVLKHGAHILEIGWEGVIKLLSDYDVSRIGKIRIFKKRVDL